MPSLGAAQQVIRPTSLSDRTLRVPPILSSDSLQRNAFSWLLAGRRGRDARRACLAAASLFAAFPAKGCEPPPPAPTPRAITPWLPRSVSTRRGQPPWLLDQLRAALGVRREPSARRSRVHCHWFQQVAFHPIRGAPRPAPRTREDVDRLGPDLLGRVAFAQAMQPPGACPPRATEQESRASPAHRAPPEPRAPRAIHASHEGLCRQGRGGDGRRQRHRRCARARMRA